MRHRKRKGAEGIAGLATIEGSIFGLMGLLLAFTISGALQRFDDRRQLVIQESTAATTAYDRLALFEGEPAHELQSKLKEYVRARIDLYRMPHDLLLWQRSEHFSDQQESKLVELKNELWDAAVAACPQANYRPACSLSLPALNSLFEVARQRAGASEKHPPQIIYFMLFGLGLGCSLLAGFGMAPAAGRSWIHMILFAGILTIALYIVTDMEYPRLGLIRIERFDHFLADAYDQMRGEAPPPSRWLENWPHASIGQSCSKNLTIGDFRFWPRLCENMKNQSAARMMFSADIPQPGRDVCKWPIASVGAVQRHVRS